MDPTTRPYARRIILLHLVLLGVVAGLVTWASDEVYGRAREQLVAQARSRQELLAKQTASAIDSYYTSIAADLSFMRRSEDMPGMKSERTDRPILGQIAPNLPPTPRLLRPLWNQLEGRVSHVVEVHRTTLAVTHAYPEGTNHEEATQTLRPFGGWLKDLEKASVSPFRPTRDGGANLIAVPWNNEYAIAAVVPVANVTEQFFRVINRDSSTIASLLDETGVVMVTSDWTNPMLRPATMPAGYTTTRAARRMMVRMGMQDLKVGTTEYPEATPLANMFAKGAVPADLPKGAMIPARLTTVEPVSMDGRTFYVVVNSRLADVTAAATTMFTRALIGAIFVILSVTAILLSTAIRLIRSRQRMETMQHEMLTKELNQARAIQMHWLPAEESCPAGLRVAAVNRTANHISGDFYDWFALPDGRAAVSIGDVTGHGMSAAFLMATTQLLVRTTLPRVMDPAACLAEVNRQLCAQSFNGQFVTMLLMVFDVQMNEVAVATAGHMPPLVRGERRARGAAKQEGFEGLKMEPQLPLGIDAGTTYLTERFGVEVGGVMVLYTDGVPDAADGGNARFGLERLVGTLGAVEGGPAELVEGVVAAVNEFGGERGLADDLTMVALRFEGVGEGAKMVGAGVE